MGSRTLYCTKSFPIISAKATAQARTTSYANPMIYGRVSSPLGVALLPALASYAPVITRRCGCFFRILNGVSPFLWLSLPWGESV